MPAEVVRDLARLVAELVECRFAVEVQELLQPLLPREDAPGIGANQVGGPTSFAGNPLWIAQYTTLCPDLTSPWDTWATAVTARPAAP